MKGKSEKFNSVLTILNYPIEEEKQVGHLDILMELFRNQKRIFRKVYVYSSRDSNKDMEIEGIKIITSKVVLPKPLSLIWDIFYLWWKFRKKPPTLIRALVPHTTGVVALVLSKLLDVPFVCSVHTDRKFVERVSGSALRKIFSPLLDILERKVYEKSVIIPVISEYISSYVLSFGKFESKVFLHHNWVDTEKFKPKKKKWDSRFVFVGRLEKEKKPHILIEALRYINQPIEVIIVGDGRERKVLEKMAKKLRKENNNVAIKFLGKVDHDKDLPLLLSSSDIMVVPYSGGFSIIEGMASGLPVISGKVEWSSEVIEDGINGILVPPDDPKALAEAMLELLKDREKLARMGKAAREKAINEFSLESWKKREEKIYRETIKAWERG